MIKLNKKLILVIAVAIVGGLSLMSLNEMDDKNFQIAKNLDIYYSLFRELNTFYVDEVDPGELITESIDEMLISLDPYTTYIPENEIEDFKFMTTGEYGGIGALISKRDEYVVVSEPYEDFPAEKAGLRAGDKFLEIDGKSVTNMDTKDVSNLLKGSPGEEIKLKVLRVNEKKPLTFDVIREKISIDPVAYYGMIDEKTGYISLTNFTKDCAEKVKKALLELREVNGAENIVLDLRGNPGGLLIEAVNLSNLFIPKGQEVVSTKGKLKQWDKTYNTIGNPVDTLMPLVVLVNRGSASASEIVSGTIQDLDRGVLIGSRTFGKGLVQTTRDLSYNAKLKITTAKYYIPSGRCIQALDYSHRNEDGSVGHIPDSLISEFTTQNGRKVYDGGGIVPDIKIEKEDISSLTINLIRQSMIFDFATVFRANNESIPVPEEFKITNELYEEFIKYVVNNEFKYSSATEDALDELKEIAKKERYIEIIDDEIEKLSEMLKHDVERDLNQFKDEISALLQNEIISRYYYQKGAIKIALQDDPAILKAKEILNDLETYNSILIAGKTE